MQASIVHKAVSCKYFIFAGKFWNAEEMCFYSDCSFCVYVEKGQRVEYDEVRLMPCMQIVGNLAQLV